MPRLQLVTAPAIEPITLAEAKLHLRVDDDQTAEDALIHGHIRTARELVETHTGYQLISATYDAALDTFPASGCLSLPGAPLQSVTSVTYYDTAGSPTVWSSSSYQVDTFTKPGRIVPAYGVTWPSTMLRPANGVIVRYVCGFGDDAGSVPEPVRHALLLIIGHLYEHREAVYTQGAGGSLFALPMGVDALLANYWAKGF